MGCFFVAAVVFSSGLLTCLCQGCSAAVLAKLLQDLPIQIALTKQPQFQLGGEGEAKFTAC